MIKIFYGEKWVVDGEGMAVKDASSGVVGVGGIKGSFQNILKQGVAKFVRRRDGVLKVSPPLPLENFNHTHSHEVQFSNNKFMDSTIQFTFP